MKKLLIFLMAIVFLAACGNDVYEADTAEMAVLNLQKDFVKDLTDLQMVEVSDTQQFAVFKAVISGEPEVFATYVQLVEGNWRVMEAIAIGHESKDDLPPMKGEYIVGELVEATTDSTDVLETNGVYTFNLPTSDRAVTVKFK